MYKAINQWSFPEGYTVKQCLELAAKAGFRAFEPGYFETGEISLETGEAKLREIREMASDMGIELTSLASGLYWKYSLTSDNAATRQKAKDIARAQLDAAAALQVPTILVVPGQVGKGFWGEGEFIYYDTAYDRALEAMLELRVHARDRGVIIGVENVWNNFLLSPLEMRDFIDKVDSPFVGMYLDVGNMLRDSFPEMWIRILNKRVARVHVKDFKIAVGNISGFVDLLSGDVNFPAVVRELTAVGYDGPLIAEMGADQHYEGDVIYRTARALDTILA